MFFRALLQFHESHKLLTDRKFFEGKNLIVSRETSKKVNTLQNLSSIYPQKPDLSMHMLKIVD